MTESNVFTCADCGHEETEEELYERYSKRRGKVDFKCADCGSRLGIEFHCVDCDEWYGGRVSLKRYDNGSICEYVCPECDGIIRKGKVLDVKQGPHR
jgi:hypothetical protein